jgi:hypothetical protein
MHVVRQPFSDVKALKKLGRMRGKAWSLATMLVVFSQPGGSSG